MSTTDNPLFVEKIKNSTLLADTKNESSKNFLQWNNDVSHNLPNPELSFTTTTNTIDTNTNNNCENQFFHFNDRTEPLENECEYNADTDSTELLSPPQQRFIETDAIELFDSYNDECLYNLNNFFHNSIIDDDMTSCSNDEISADDSIECIN